MAGSKDNIRLQRWVVIIGVVLLGAKFSAFAVTGSNAILTDALESVVNVVAGIFALYSLVLASRPRDLNHPYGHGKIEFISASVEGALITLAGVAIMVKSVHGFFYPPGLRRLDLGILLVVVSGAVNFIVGLIMERRGKRSHSLTLIAGGKHLKSDAYSTAGLLVGLAVIYFTHWEWMDNAVAILFGGIIVFTGYRILRRSVSGIMDEADMALLQQIIGILNDNRRVRWIDVHNMRVIRYGSTLHIDCHLTVPYYLHVREAHTEVEAIGQLISRHFENQVEFFIHTDGCETSSCSICSVPDCPVRQQVQQRRLEWTADNVLQNQKHYIV